MKRNVIAPLLALFVALCLLAACQPATPPDLTPAEPPTDGLFVHIKSGPDDAHSVLMGLRMAQIMVPDRDVLVYFDVKGIEAVLEASPDMAMEPFGSARGIIADLVSQGATLYACPGCLKALGHTPEELIEGIDVADKEAFFDFTEGRILTIDY